MRTTTDITLSLKVNVAVSCSLVSGGSQLGFRVYEALNSNGISNGMLSAAEDQKKARGQPWIDHMNFSYILDFFVHFLSLELS